MFPVIVDFGTFSLFGREIPLVIGSYGLVFAIAILIGWGFVRTAGRSIYPDAPWTDLYFGAVIAGFVGAKLANGIVFLPDILSGRRPLTGVLMGGGVWLGGAIAGAGFLYLLSRKCKLEFGRVTNVFFTGIPLVHGIGRIACLLGGCCFGSECSPGLPWAVTYTNPLAAKLNGTPLYSPRHPAPVYEFLAEMINFAICYAIWRRKPKPWQIISTWSVLYGIERFIIELFRSDARGQYGWLTTSQWISVLMVLGGSAALFFLVRKSAPKAEVAAEQPAPRRKKRRR